MTVLALELRTFDGIPLHPLLVHAPVVLVPLALLGALVALAVPRWRSWCAPLTAAFAAVSLVAVQLAIMSGEGLEEILDEESALIERHAQLAEQSRPFLFAFAVVAVAAAVAGWQRQRPSNAAEGAPARSSLLVRAMTPLLVLSVLTGALSTVWIYRTGHSGAESVWEGEGDEGGDEGGTVDDGDDDDGDRGAERGDEPVDADDDD